MIDLKKELPDIPDKEVMKIKSILTQEDVNELFDYKDGDLYWKIDFYNPFGSKIITAGTKAGTIHYNGVRSYYKQIGYNRKIYKTSRLIFLMYYGYLPERVVYKDGDTLNTRIENLLEANTSQASYRNKKLSNNTIGYKGLVFDKRVGKYKASITKNRIRVFLGYYGTAEEAYRAYIIAKEKYYGDFINKCENT